MRVCEPLRGSPLFLRDPADIRALSRSQDVAYEAGTGRVLPARGASRARSRVLRYAHEICGSERRRLASTEVRIKCTINRQGPDVPAGKFSLLPKTGCGGNLFERGRRRTWSSTEGHPSGLQTSRTSSRAKERALCKSQSRRDVLGVVGSSRGVLYGAKLSGRVEDAGEGRRRV